jgi:hypothetical protein
MQGGCVSTYIQQRPQARCYRHNIHLSSNLQIPNSPTYCTHRAADKSLPPSLLLLCLQVGTQPRSVAVILLRWRREYYKSKEECCKEQDNIPGCDCSWGGVSAYTWENMPPPKAYSRLFTDECDKGPSLNRVRAAVRLVLHLCVLPLCVQCLLSCVVTV